MYHNLRRALPEGAPESIHFCDIPEAEAAQVGGAAGCALCRFTASSCCCGLREKRAHTAVASLISRGSAGAYSLVSGSLAEDSFAQAAFLLTAGRRCTDPDERGAHAARDRAGTHHSGAARARRQDAGGWVGRRVGGFVSCRIRERHGHGVKLLVRGCA